MSDIRELLPDFLDGTLNTDQHRAVEQAAQADPALRDEIDELRAVMELLSSEGADPALWGAEPAAEPRLSAEDFLAGLNQRIEAGEGADASPLVDPEFLEPQAQVVDLAARRAARAASTAAPAAVRTPSTGATAAGSASAHEGAAAPTPMRRRRRTPPWWGWGGMAAAAAAVLFTIQFGGFGTSEQMDQLTRAPESTSALASGDAVADGFDEAGDVDLDGSEAGQIAGEEPPTGTAGMRRAGVEAGADSDDAQQLVRAPSADQSRADQVEERWAPDPGPVQQPPMPVATGRSANAGSESPVLADATAAERRNRDQLAQRIDDNQILGLMGTASGGGGVAEGAGAGSDNTALNAGMSGILGGSGDATLGEGDAVADLGMPLEDTEERSGSASGYGAETARRQADMPQEQSYDFGSDRRVAEELAEAEATTAEGVFADADDQDSLFNDGMLAVAGEESGDTAARDQEIAAAEPEDDDAERFDAVADSVELDEADESQSFQEEEAERERIVVVESRGRGLARPGRRRESARTDSAAAPPSTEPAAGAATSADGAVAQSSGGYFSRLAQAPVTRVRGLTMSQLNALVNRFGGVLQAGQPAGVWLPGAAEAAFAAALEAEAEAVSGVRSLSLGDGAVLLKLRLVE